MLTILDQIANQNHLQLMKAVIPYLKPNSQKMFSVCIKMLELQNVLRYYKQNETFLGACSTPQETPGILDILTDIRNYCEDGEQEMIDQCIQIFTAMELYSIFSEQPGEYGPAPQPGDFESAPLPEDSAPSPQPGDFESALLPEDSAPSPQPGDFESAPPPEDSPPPPSQDTA